MPNLNKRLNDLEKATGQGDDTPRITVLINNSIAPGDLEAGRAGRVAFIAVIPPDGSPAPRYSRGDDETKRAFLDRAGEGYRAMHGTLPDDWYETDAA